MQPHGATYRKVHADADPGAASKGNEGVLGHRPKLSLALWQPPLWAVVGVASPILIERMLGPHRSVCRQHDSHKHRGPLGGGEMQEKRREGNQANVELHGIGLSSQERFRARMSGKP